jgi:hypothetical protein
MSARCRNCGRRRDQPGLCLECEHGGELRDLERHYSREEIAAACHATGGQSHG